MTPEQATFMDGLFKFKIGDVVRHVVGADNDSSDIIWGGAGIPKRCMITERLLQECPGGIQLHYGVKVSTPNGDLGVEPVRVMEIELVASKPFAKPERKERTRTEAADGPTP